MNKENKCIVCEGEIHRDEIIKDRRSRITCSKKCSKIYDRIYHYITQKLKYDKLKVDDIINELKNLIRNAGRSSLINKDEIENLIVKYK